MGSILQTMLSLDCTRFTPIMIWFTVIRNLWWKLKIKIDWLIDWLIDLSSSRAKLELNETRATFLTNQIQNQNQSRLGHTRFPVLGDSLLVFASSSHWFIVLFTFFVIGHCNCFGLQRSIENRSIHHLQYWINNKSLYRDSPFPRLRASKTCCWMPWRTWKTITAPEKKDNGDQYIQGGLAARPGT